MILKTFKHIFLSFLISITFMACSNDDDPAPDTTGGDVDNPDPDTNPDQDVDPNNGGCESGKVAVFVEKDGLLVIESENASFNNTNWTFTKSVADFSGSGYLVWNGGDAFNQPGNGTLTYKIRISTPGTYRFLWRSYITIGTNGTEHNDSWLRIADAKHFYGKKGNGNIVYPKGTMQEPIPESEGQATTTPVGSGQDGWFKIFMNTASAWHWQSSTSDRDGHDIFVVFETAGDYTVEVSGRSKGHGIDKFVLFTNGTASATDGATSEIKCE